METVTQPERAAESSLFRILLVCTGNICRSPMAERLLQKGFDERYPNRFIVESAGTNALVGNPIDPQVATLLRAYGGNTELFAARQISPDLIERNDLILGLTRDHRRQIVEASPTALQRSFTLLELARLSLQVAPLPPEDDAADRWRGLTRKALRLRQAIADPTGDDVVDPYRKPSAIYNAMADTVGPAVDKLLAW